MFKQSSNTILVFRTLLTVIVLLVTAINLFYCLPCGKIEEWDEARRGIAALEMLKSGNYFVNTYLGNIDYWSVKPPLGLWLIVGSYKLFDPSVFALRFPSACCALLTIIFTALIGIKKFGYDVAITGSAILVTCFPFILEHSARAGEYDSPLAMLITLSVLALYSIQSAILLAVCLGVIFAAVFLLKSFSIIIPIGIFSIWLVSKEKNSNWRFAHTLTVFVLTALIIGIWAINRYQIDGYEFFYKMLQNDLSQRSLTAVEGHGKGILYYPFRILKTNLWWSAFALFIIAFSLRKSGNCNFGNCKINIPHVLASWMLIPLVVATLMQTKIPWYINSTYPCLALTLGVLTTKTAKINPWVVKSIFLLALLIGEIRIIDKINKNSLLPADQSLLRNIDNAQGKKIAAFSWTQTQIFIAIVEKKLLPITISTPEDFIATAKSEDFLFIDSPLKSEYKKKLYLAQSAGQYGLYKISPNS